MHDMTRWAGAAALATSGFLMIAFTPLGAAPQVPGIARTVYISAIDAKGGFVDDLTPGDLVVKENGRAHEITRLERATEQCHVAIVVDDGGEGHLQMPVAQLLMA